MERKTFLFIFEKNLVTNYAQKEVRDTLHDP